MNRPAPSAGTDATGDPSRKQLEAENTRLKRMVEVLMDASESAVSSRGSDYSLFSTAVLLEDRVRERTTALENALRQLRHANTELAQTQQHAEQSRALLSTAISATSDGFALFDAEDRLLLWNDPFASLWSSRGGSLSLEEGMDYESLLRRIADSELIPEDADTWLQKRLEHHYAGAGAMEFELADGRWIRVGERPTDTGGTVGVYADITDIKVRANALREAELATKSKLLQASLDSIPQGISVFDSDHHLVAWNERFVELLEIPQGLVSNGISYEELLRFDWGPDDRHCDDSGGRLRPCVPVTHERRMPSGRHLEIVRQSMPDGGFVTTYTDISGRIEAAEHMQFLATHDPLTGIPNRTLLLESLRTELARCRRQEIGCAVMFMDMDDFKQVNDRFGHDVGDSLLQAFASRLTGLMRESDTVARLGGDEFAVLLPDVPSAADVAQLAQRMLQAMEHPFDVDGHTIVSGASIGIAVYPEHATDTSSLLRCADVAMYHAKRRRSGYQLFEAGLELSPLLNTRAARNGD